MMQIAKDLREICKYHSFLFYFFTSNVDMFQHLFFKKSWNIIKYSPQRNMIFLFTKDTALLQAFGVKALEYLIILVNKLSSIRATKRTFE